MPIDATPLNLEPRAEEILAELESIGKSGRVSEQPLKILRYVVAQTLAGKAGEIKESTVGVYALGMNPHKDTGSVRGHAFNLRSQLSGYYASQEKWRVRVIIEIPKGGYRPQFSYPAPETQFSAAEASALLSAQTALDRLTLPAMQAAIDHLDEILKVHPDHPLVLAMKADVHSYRGMHGLPPRKEIDVARQLAERAVTLAPGMWQTQTTYGYIQAVLRNWNEARMAFDKATAIPKAADVPAHPSYVAYLSSQGEIGEAIRLVKQILDSAKGYYGGLAPSRPIVHSDLCFYLLSAGRLEEAIQMLDAALKDNDFYLFYIYRAIAQEALDDPAGAVRILRKTPIKWNETAMIWGLMGLFLGLSGSRLRARLELWKLKMAKTVLRAYVPASQFLIAYLGLGEHQKAIHCMRQMILDCDPLFLGWAFFPFCGILPTCRSFTRFSKRQGLSGDGEICPRF